LWEEDGSYSGLVSSEKLKGSQKMSKKVLTSMKDENPELQKQIGCISGFFQLFDRHRFLTGQQGSSLNQNIPTKGNIICNISVIVVYAF